MMNPDDNELTSLTWLHNINILPHQSSSVVADKIKPNNFRSVTKTNSSMQPGIDRNSSLNACDSKLLKDKDITQKLKPPGNASEFEKYENSSILETVVGEKIGLKPASKTAKEKTSPQDMVISSGKEAISLSPTSFSTDIHPKTSVSIKKVITKFNISIYQILILICNIKSLFY